MMKPTIRPWSLDHVDNDWRSIARSHVSSWMVFQESGSKTNYVGVTPTIGMGRLDGNATRISAPFGDAVSFDGAGDSILIGNVPVNHRLQLLNGGTVVAIIKPSSIGDNFARIIDKSDNANGVNGWAVCINSVSSGSMFVRLNGVTDGDSDTGVLINDEWQTIAVSWIPNGPTHFSRLSFSGAYYSEASENVSAANNAETPIRIGAWNHTELRFFEGQMGLVSVYDTIFTEPGIQKLLANPFGLFHTTRPREHIHRIRRLQMRGRR